MLQLIEATFLIQWGIGLHIKDKSRRLSKIPVILSLKFGENAENGKPGTSSFQGYRDYMDYKKGYYKHGIEGYNKRQILVKFKC